ncbi:LysR substrate-binding domain-containing protein [Aestuariispira ectoiniformans]|uniref:LysR substrate-binding domain-containing protein n=1 Tax=Aestuariispira ectoiniformans TaxID=2775080 RepID=UPI00223BC831|nr:LysR substrate-binding domain-containing protein [Aestuariispira ectoiniformans]
MRRLRNTIPSANALFTFEAAARLLSFTKAADELGVSQAAVSYAIKRLEEFLGVSLFNREYRKLSLTEVGERFFHDVTIGMSHIQRSVEDIRRSHKGGYVTLSASTAFANYWLLPRMARFRNEHPNVDIRVLTTDKDVDLAAEGISLGIRRGPDDWMQYSSQYFTHEAVYAACSPDYLKQVGPITGPADLLACRLIHLEEPYRPRLTWEQWLATFGVKGVAVEEGLFMNDYALVIHAALEGEGVAMGWHHLTDDLVAKGQLVKILPDTMETDVGFYVTWPKHWRLSKEAEALRDWLVREGNEEENARKENT